MSEDRNMWCGKQVHTGLVPRGRGVLLPVTATPYEGIGQYVPVYHTTNFYSYSFRIHSPMEMEQTQCSETSAIKHLTPENNLKGYIRHSEPGESLKSRKKVFFRKRLANPFHYKIPQISTQWETSCSMRTEN
jgi:hypothetical protein